jgi:alkylation response protein AidB-like acyl-CoA dehydrogenase
MDSTSHSELGSSARRYFSTRGTPQAEAGSWREVAELGWLGAVLPEELGGYGGPHEMVVLAQAFGEALAPEPFLQASVVPIAFLARTASPPRYEGLLSRAMSGDVMVIADLGPCNDSLRSDINFTRTAEGCRLQGTTTPIVGGSRAGCLMIAASDAAHPEQASVFVLDPATPGVTAACITTIDGRAGRIYRFEDVLAAGACECPNREEADMAWGFACDAAVLGQSAEMVGVMDRALNLTTDYLRSRRQFGQPLSSFQVLRHRLADMYADLELARSMLGVGIAAMHNPSASERGRLVSACKIRAINAARLVGAQAIQLHGAIALTEEYAVGRCYKRLMVLERTWGGLEFHARRFHGPCQRHARIPVTT